jgi:hypothetical protein
MYPGTVALMSLKSIARPLNCQLTHHPITFGLGKDRGCTDRGDLGVTPDDGLPRARQIGGQLVAIDQGEQGLDLRA